MDDDFRANLLHCDRRGRTVGEAIAPAVVFAAKYHVPGDPTGVTHTYGRSANPTWEALESVLAAFEGAETIVFPSGMAAISAVLMATLRSGDTVMLPADGYYVTRAFADEFLRPLGVSAIHVPTAEYATADLTGVRLVWIETPSNPSLDSCDIHAVTSRAHDAGALVVADNTTMTALLQRPLDLGVDVVVSSDTKAISGHGDVLAGHVSSSNSGIVDRVRSWRRMAGGIIGPMEAFLVQRGLHTLDVRLERMCATAAVLATRCSSHSGVQRVRYPGLASDPSFAVHTRQAANGGFLIGLTLADATAADAFIAACSYVVPATSFGGVQTSAERRDRWGDPVPGGFVRVSVGCEPVEALWRDLDQALHRATTTWR